MLTEYLNLFDCSSPFSSRDVLEKKSEKTKIAWPKNAKAKMLREPVQKCLKNSMTSGNHLEIPAIPTEENIGENSRIQRKVCNISQSPEMLLDFAKLDDANVYNI